MQGRAFGFLAVLGASWVAIRVAIATVAPSAQIPKADAITTPFPTIANFAPLPTFIAEPAHRNPHNKPVGHMVRSQAARSHKVRTNAASPVSRSQTWIEVGPATRFPSQPLSCPPDHSIGSPVPAAAFPLATQSSGAPKKRPFELYAYSFWRRGHAQPGLVGYGQYGGSQSAIIVHVPLLRFGGDKDIARLAVTGRLSVAHSLPSERELAAGLKWRPSLDIPVSVIAERRFRQDRPDAVAFFASGGWSDARLPLQFRLDGFGQAGVVSGSSGGVFVDAMLQARRPVGKIGPVGLSVGAGAWAGGQDEVLRVDMGPSVAADVPLAGAQVRLEASWRLRVAGNAPPGNGPAITLSTSF